MKKTTLDDLLNRGVDGILPSKKGLESLLKKRKIRLYNGADATSPNLHLGHATILRKLQQFADLGHEVIFLVGDFTSLIGDTSDKESERPKMSLKQVKENIKTWQKQASKIIDLKKVKIVRNSTWLKKLGYEDILNLAQNFTVQQMIERDMYQRRIKAGKPIGLHEFLYPLMQGYDSTMLDVDLEIGGTDQTFNMLAGRTLQKNLGKREKYVMTLPLLMGSDGQKMSKSLGNTINITDEPNNMFGKIMRVRDDLMKDYFVSLTDMSMADIKKITAKNSDPFVAKKKLAFEIVKMIHNEAKAKSAEREFTRTFSKKGTPNKLPTLKIGSTQTTIMKLLQKTKTLKSNSEIKRLISQGSIKVDGETIKNKDALVRLSGGEVLKVGKRQFFKIKLI